MIFDFLGHGHKIEIVGKRLIFVSGCTRIFCCAPHLHSEKCAKFLVGDIREFKKYFPFGNFWTLCSRSSKKDNQSTTNI